MTEQKLCPFETGHLAPITFFNKDVSRKDGLAVYCKRHASEKMLLGMRDRGLRPDLITEEKNVNMECGCY